jgi:hypothetical protein
MPRSSLKQRVSRAREQQRRLVSERRRYARSGTEEARAALLRVAKLEDHTDDSRAHHLVITALLAVDDLRDHQEKRS